MKTSKQIFLILATGLQCAIFCSCQNPQKSIPVLPEDKISRIMADLAIADAATTGLSGYAKDSLMHVYFKQVFDMHGTTQEAYESDLRILATDLSRMEIVVKKADELLTENGTGMPDAKK
jgi:hypothetical protein